MFQDQQFVQPLGRQNKTFSFEIPFFEGLDGLPLYSETYPRFIQACEDREPKILEVPDFGAYRVVAARIECPYRPGQVRDGTLVSVEFVEAPELSDITDPATSRFLGPQGLIQSASRLDDEIPDANIPDYEPPQGGFSNPLKSAAAVLDQISLTRNQFKAKAGRPANDLKRLNESIDNTGDPKNWTLKRQSNDLRLAIHDSTNRVEETGETVFNEILKTPRSLVSLAADLGMTLKELIKLNAELAKLPVVPAGTIVRRRK